IRLEAMVKEIPDYVLATPFHHAQLLADQGRFAEAIPKYVLFIQQNPKSPLLPEAQLREGICMVQLKQVSEAPRVLTPLGDNPQLGDQALLWLGRAKIASADPSNPQAQQSTF